MQSEEFRHSDIIRLPPIVPRYNYDLLNSLDDIYLEEMREDPQWVPSSDFLPLCSQEDLNGVALIECESPQLITPDNFFASSIKNSTWTCPLCLDLLNDPVEAPCCHSLCCGSCIEPFPRCPICKALLLRCLPNIPMKRLVQELSVRCRHPLCDKIVRKAFLLTHESLCENGLVRCGHSEACGQVLRKDLQVHLVELCPHRPVHCLLHCGSVMQQMALQGHLDRECPEANLACPQECGARMMRKEVQTHCSEQCPNTTVLCPLSARLGAVCGVGCLRKDLEEHRLTCNYRQVRCGSGGCKEKVMYMCMQEHEEVCGYVIVQCGNRCGAEFLRKEIEKHRRVCELEEVECRYMSVGCKEKMVRGRWDMHLGEARKAHEVLVLRTHEKNCEGISRLENELCEFRTKTGEEIAWMMRMMKVQRKEDRGDNVDEEMPNPFCEILNCNNEII